MSIATHSHNAAPDVNQLQPHLETNGLGLNGVHPANGSSLPKTSISSDDNQHELPLLVPLSHTHPLLLSSQPFDVDAFLLSRSNLSLQDLRSELRSYQAQLKEELVQLINDDYAAFISLSTDLKGEGARLERLQRPLATLRTEVEKSRDELSAVQLAVQEKLAERATLREEKALLHLLLKLSDSVVRLESLLLIASSEQTANSISATSADFSALGIRGMNGLPISLGDDDVKEDRSRGGQAKHLSRVAAEYTQLLYHAEKAREERCAFVDEIQWRIDRIKSTLSRDLDHLFSNTLASLTSSSVEAASVADKARWTSDLTECLRTYDVLRGWREAEEVVRRDLVRPFVKNTIFSGALNVAPSPILVRTLLPGKSGAMSPRTPFTPFTAHRGNPFDTLAANPLPLLPEGDDDPLASLYNTVLRFVQINCTGVMELSEKVSSKTRKTARKAAGLFPPFDGSQPRTSSEEDIGVNPDGFEVMANVIWAEIGRSLMEELGNTVFSAGNPDEFQKNYSTTNDFISALEHLAPSYRAVEIMREHPTHVAFQRRWQLPVYFQLRWKEIVGKLEDSLISQGSRRGEPIHEDFVSTQATAVYTAIQACWSHHVYIPELAHRFWRLTLQILSRYKTWLDTNLPPRELPTSVTAALASDKASLARSATPVPSNPTSTAEASVADQTTLLRFASAFIDVCAMERRILYLWQSEISILLPDSTTEEDAGNNEAVLKASVSALTELLPDIATQIIIILTRRCSEALSLVRSIAFQYRAMNKKRDPTGPSEYVPNILQPVRQFLEQDGLAEFISNSDRKNWVTQVFEAVCIKYTAYLDAMKQTEESLRRYKKGKISAFSLFGGGSSRENEESKDEERVRAQMVLDVEALGQDARRLGVEIDAIEAYATLKATAASSGE